MEGAESVMGSSPGTFTGSTLDDLLARAGVLWALGARTAHTETIDHRRWSDSGPATRAGPTWSRRQSGGLEIPSSNLGRVTLDKSE